VIQYRIGFLSQEGGMDATDRGRDEKNGTEVVKTTGPQTGDIIGQVMKLIDKAISSADEKAAGDRVAAWRTAHPGALVEVLVEALIKAKAQQTAAVGAATASTDVVPGLGTLAALALGTAADIGVTFRLQSELVLEIAAAYGHPLAENEKRDAVLVVTGISVGANRLLSKAGRDLAERAAERFAGRSVLKAVPFLGIAASAGANALTTYVIGRRAAAYFERGPEAMGDWADNLRALTGVDERRIGGWLAETVETTGVAGTARAVGQALGATGGAATGAVAATARHLRRALRRS
jgi:hypothetical protein